MVDINELLADSRAGLACFDRFGDDFIIDTPNGKMYLKHDCDPKTGMIDMKSGPTKDEMWNTPTRVVSDNMGGAFFIFTIAQVPGQSDEEFEQGCEGLAHEFEVIRKIVEK